MPLPDGSKTSWEAARERHAKEVTQAKEAVKDPIITEVMTDIFMVPPRSVSTKAEIPTLEYPFFSLSKTPDMKIRKFVFPNFTIEIIPGQYGMATIWDQDILLYLIGHQARRIDQREQNLKKSRNLPGVPVVQDSEILRRGDQSDRAARTIRFPVADYLKATKKNKGGRRYKCLYESLTRLIGTTIKTDITTGGIRQMRGFNLIESWEIIGREAETDLKKIVVEVTLSQWTHNAIQNREILTISEEYFSITSATKRRLYGIARKGCGNQSSWKIGLELLRLRTGSQTDIRFFRREIRQIADVDDIPQYRISLDNDTDVVTFTRRPSAIK